MQDQSGYNFRGLVETTMFQYKTIIGEKLYSRDLSVQKVEAKTACLILNKMAQLLMPKTSHPTCYLYNQAIWLLYCYYTTIL